jgi:hypothetical protein
MSPGIPTIRGRRSAEWLLIGWAEVDPGTITDEAMQTAGMRRVAPADRTKEALDIIVEAVLQAAAKWPMSSCTQLTAMPPVTARWALRHRDGRVDHRPVQDRGDPLPRTMAQSRRGRDGPPGAGRLVEQPPPLRGPGRHPTGRGRIGLLRHHDAVRQPSNGRTNPPLNSGRFNSVLEVRSRHGPRDSPTWKLVPADCRLRAAFGL